MSTNIFTIDNMIGQSYKYKGVLHNFLAFRKEGDKIILVTDKKWFEFADVEDMSFFIAECETVMDVEPLPTTDSSGLIIPDSGSDDVMAKLKGVLLESIDKLTKDKDYVPQAKAISNSVQTLTNLVKMELQIKRQG